MVHPDDGLTGSGAIRLDPGSVHQGRPSSVSSQPDPLPLDERLPQGVRLVICPVPRTNTTLVQARPLEHLQYADRYLPRVVSRRLNTVPRSSTFSGRAGPCPPPPPPPATLFLLLLLLDFSCWGVWAAAGGPAPSRPAALSCLRAFKGTVTAPAPASTAATLLLLLASLASRPTNLHTTITHACPHAPALPTTPSHPDPSSPLSPPSLAHKAHTYTGAAAMPRSPQPA
ncbi:hypothetical protein VDGL01_04802 [Verticillium dahliae]